MIFYGKHVYDVQLLYTFHSQNSFTEPMKLSGRTSVYTHCMQYGPDQSLVLYFFHSLIV